eukprot:m.335766 g.335766  ORF g.335766 m.335766 type:complete len:1204 (-) comp17672_c0_seq1:1765-5376(-)
MSSMFLYQLTLQRGSQITQCIHGNFSGTKQQLIAVGKGKVLELLRPDASTGKIVPLLSTEIFGAIRSMQPFRLTGGSKDYIVLGTDSGRITIVEYIPTKNVFQRVHMETFGKSGCRRIIPGQYLAIDPKGRAIMIGAVEKQKLVYILNRDSAARLTISSPLEAHKTNTLIFDTIGIDVGFDNPIFACLEMDYEEADQDPTGEALEELQQTLTFYELDLGLNHVVRKQSDPLEVVANKLIRVPGGSDGPGGVLVCSENLITYRNIGDVPPVSVRIPRRADCADPKRGSIVTNWVMHIHKHIMFFLIQTEMGDLFKLTLDVEDDEVKQINLKYFDTVPVSAGMSLLKNGLLFVAAEYGNQTLYQVAQLGDNEDEPTYSNLSPPTQSFEFRPRKLLNLVSIDEVESLAPIMSCTVADLANEDSPQLYAACGKGARSNMRVMRHGLEVTQWAVSPLPGNPNAVWTVKRHVSDPYDSYIVVSFINATLVLSIGDTVEEVTDSGFLPSVPTLSASRIGDDALIQVYPQGIRHIRADKRVNEWKAPANRAITQCAVNERQVAIALAGGEIVYFEMDSSGQLNEYTERMEMEGEVTSMGIAPVPPGLQRSKFLGIGSADNTVRVVSLDPKDCLQPMSMQALPALPESLCVMEMTAGEGEQSTLYMNIGLENGVLLRTVIDTNSGDLSDTRTRYLGSRGVKLFRVTIQENDAVLALSSRPWLNYMYQGLSKLTPLSYETLEHASSFTSEQCPEGIVACAKNTLRVLSLENLGSVFNSKSTPLRMTPRDFVVDPSSNTLVVVGGDNNTSIPPPSGGGGAEDESKMNVEESEESQAEQEKLEAVLAERRDGLGKFIGSVCVVDPLAGKTLHSLDLETNEVPVSVCAIQFSAVHDGFQYIIVGTVTDWDIKAQKFSACHLLTYRLIGEGDRRTTLELVHRTSVEAVPAALHAFNGRLLAGIGNLLRLYDIGKRKLLRKCENKGIPNLVVHITSMGHRILACDLKESYFWVRYKMADNQLVIFADDTNSRYLTRCALLDYSTVAGVDKFGNVNISRLPEGASDNIDEDPTGNKALWERGLLNGAAQKVETLANYHLGETALSIQKATLTPGGSECLVYTTLAGGVGVLLPFTNKEDVDFFQHLEMHLRAENPPLCGRDHLSYRSYYYPVKNVIDGDLCEQYNALEAKKRRAIAEDLDRTPAEVSKKLEDLRNRYAF